MKDLQTKCLGSITLDGSGLGVSDPCYLKKGSGESGEVDSGLAGHGILEQVPEGTFPVWIEISDEGSFGRRVSALWVEFAPGGRDAARQRQEGELGVDSGQMMMFRMSALPEWGGDLADDRPNEEGEDFHAKWSRLVRENEGEFNYQGACGATGFDTERYGGMVGGDRAAACSSGYGDGSYPLFVHEDSQGSIVAVSVEFISEEDDEAEDFEDERDEDEEEEER